MGVDVIGIILYFGDIWGFITGYSVLLIRPLAQIQQLTAVGAKGAEMVLR